MKSARSASGIVIGSTANASGAEREPSPVPTSSRATEVLREAEERTGDDARAEDAHERAVPVEPGRAAREFGHVGPEGGTPARPHSAPTSTDVMADGRRPGSRTTWPAWGAAATMVSLSGGLSSARGVLLVSVSSMVTHLRTECRL